MLSDLWLQDFSSFRWLFFCVCRFGRFGRFFNSICFYCAVLLSVNVLRCEAGTFAMRNAQLGFGVALEPVFCR